MSEFSIEEKANAYDIALKKAKTLLSKCKRVSDKASMIYRAEDIENMFPEFQKPEEERIKEALIELVKCNERSGYTLLNNVSTSSMINWLEKQDKEIVYQPKNDDKNLKNVLIRFFEDRYPKAMEIYDGDFTVTVGQILAWLEKQNFCQNNVNHNIAEKEKKEFIGDGFIKCCADFQDFREGETYWLEYLGDDNYNVRSDNLLSKIYHITPCQLYTIFKKQTWFEKQSQSYLAPKSASQAIKEIIVDNANKVELKFHEGDFIKHNKSDIVYKVFSICNNSYFLKNIETDEIAGEFERFNLEQNFHLWTIQDAKNGDILWHSDSASNGIFIFKEIRSDGKVLCYCDYDSEDHFCLGEHHTCCWINDKYIKPATKEQRYLLFKKTQESGYIWDADKKKLKKIEVEPENYKQQLMSENT